MRRLDFADHRRELGDNRHVYAVVSRRSRGLSVGVNLNPDAACSFACPYCQVDRTAPRRDRRVDLDRLEAELDRLLALAASGRIWSVPPFDTAAPPLRRLADVAFAGDGEPTARRELGPALGIALDRLRAHDLGRVPVVVLTNALLLHRADVAAALDRLLPDRGEVWAKLDAGTPEGLRRAAGVDVPVRRLLDNLRLAARRWPLALQALFFTWEGRPPPERELDAWAERVAEVAAAGPMLREVQVGTVARRPADPRVGPLDDAALRAVAARVAGLGVRVRVVPAAGPAFEVPPA